MRKQCACLFNQTFNHLTNKINSKKNSFCAGFFFKKNFGKLTHCKQLFIEIEVFYEEQKTLQIQWVKLQNLHDKEVFLRQKYTKHLSQKKYA